MELFFPIERALWIASVLAEALVAVQFFRQGLVKRYPLFVAFLIAEVICSVVLMRYDLKSRGYAEAYRITEPIMTVFRLGAAAEVYERICEHFPGIGIFRAVMASVLVLVAGLFAAFTVRPNLAQEWVFPQTITFVILRFQGEIFAGAFILTWIFLRVGLSIRQPFRPNVLIHWTIATIYFGALGVLYLAILLVGVGNAILPINCVILATQCACFVAWFRLMRRSGEQVPASPRLSADQLLAVENYSREVLKTVTSLPGEIAARQAESPEIPARRWRRR